jgi:hypothetical protein
MSAGAQLRAHTIRRRRAAQGCRSYAALRLGEPDRLRFLIGGNAKGFALSFPKAEMAAPVWRASPAGPRQGGDSAFPSPTHPRRKAGRMAAGTRLAADGIGI